MAIADILLSSPDDASHQKADMTLFSSLSFDTDDLCRILGDASEKELDTLELGVIGFDGECFVRRYNTFESTCAGLPVERVLGHQLFTEVAPCMNNYLVAQRFEDAASAGQALDDVLDYVLTLRMRPVKVKLRLLADPGAALRFVLVQRRG